MSPTSAFPAGAAAAGAAAGAGAAVLGTFTKSKLEAASNQATMLDHWTVLDFTFSDQPYRNSALRTRQTTTKNIEWVISKMLLPCSTMLITFILCLPFTRNAAYCYSQHQIPQIGVLIQNITKPYQTTVNPY